MRRVTGSIDFWNEEKEIKGLFHQWGTVCEKFENGGVQVTMAIVELDDGSIVNVYPSRLKFDKELYN